MTFDKLKPGMVLYHNSIEIAHNWTVVKKVSGSMADIEDYWETKNGNCSFMDGDIEESDWVSTTLGISEPVTLEQTKQFVRWLFENKIRITS